MQDLMRKVRNANDVGALFRKDETGGECSLDRLWLCGRACGDDPKKRTQRDGAFALRQGRRYGTDKNRNVSLEVAALELCPLLIYSRGCNSVSLSAT